MRGAAAGARAEELSERRAPAADRGPVCWVVGVFGQAPGSGIERGGFGRSNSGPDAGFRRVVGKRGLWGYEIGGVCLFFLPLECASGESRDAVGLWPGPSGYHI